MKGTQDPQVSQRKGRRPESSMQGAERQCHKDRAEDPPNRSFNRSKNREELKRARDILRKTPIVKGTSEFITNLGEKHKIEPTHQPEKEPITENEFNRVVNIFENCRGDKNLKKALDEINQEGKVFNSTNELASTLIRKISHIGENDD